MAMEALGAANSQFAGGSSPAPFQHFNYRCSHRSAAVASCKFVGEIFFRCESACFGSIFPGWEPLQEGTMVHCPWLDALHVYLWFKSPCQHFWWFADYVHKIKNSNGAARGWEGKKARSVDRERLNP
ncbi:uncharacterized protein [Physcomitrium patens]|uniref:uncharacterized protein isoform X2 n=1 Tax=Physcomitrium patens TaxID=3218 RepID=UPI003CCD5092